MSFKVFAICLILHSVLLLIQVPCINSASLRKNKDMEDDNAFSVKYQPLNKYEKECVILNENYQNGYLYAVSSAYKIQMFYRSVFLWKPIFGQNSNLFTNNDPQGVWILMPVQNRLDTYYIYNVKYGEYLCAYDMWKIDKLLSNRRTVATDMSNKLDNKDEKYMWEFRRMDNGKYEIWNVKFIERKFNESIQLD